MKYQSIKSLKQSNAVNADSDGAIESVRINRLSVLSGLNLGKM